MGCDKPIDFTKLSKGQKQRIIKKAEGEWSNAGNNKDTPCAVCMKNLKDDAIQCDKLILKNGKTMTFVDGSRDYKVFKFEDSANAVTTETQEDAESLPGSVAPTSEFDIQTEGSRRSAGNVSEQPSLQDLLESAQNLSHRDYIVYKNKVIEMFDADGYSK